MGHMEIQTGQLILGEGRMIIYPLMAWEDFESSQADSLVEWRDAREDRTKCVLAPQEIHGVPFRISLRFRQGRLDLVSMVHAETRSPSWETWSGDREAQTKQFHDDWLKDHIGVPPYAYAWGRIESLYIMQEATSKILIAYAR